MPVRQNFSQFAIEDIDKTLREVSKKKALEQLESMAEFCPSIRTTMNGQEFISWIVSKVIKDSQKEEVSIADIERKDRIIQAIEFPSEELELSCKDYDYVMQCFETQKFIKSKEVEKAVLSVYKFLKGARRCLEPEGDQQYECKEEY